MCMDYVLIFIVWRFLRGLLGGPHQNFFPYFAVFLHFHKLDSLNSILAWSSNLFGHYLTLSGGRRRQWRPAWAGASPFPIVHATAWTVSSSGCPPSDPCTLSRSRCCWAAKVGSRAVSSCLSPSSSLCRSGVARPSSAFRWPVRREELSATAASSSHWDDYPFSIPLQDDYDSRSPCEQSVSTTSSQGFSHP